MPLVSCCYGHPVHKVRNPGPAFPLLRPKLLTHSFTRDAPIGNQPTRHSRKIWPCAGISEYRSQFPFKALALAQQFRRSTIRISTRTATRPLQVELSTVPANFFCRKDHEFPPTAKEEHLMSVAEPNLRA